MKGSGLRIKTQQPEPKLCRVYPVWIHAEDEPGPGPDEPPELRFLVYIYMYIYLSIHLSIYLSIYLPIDLNR